MVNDNTTEDSTTDISYSICVPCIQYKSLSQQFILNLFNKLEFGNISKIDIIPIRKQQKRFISSIEPYKSENKFTIFIHFDKIYKTDHALRILARFNKKKSVYVCEKELILRCVQNNSKN